MWSQALCEEVYKLPEPIPKGAEIIDMMVKKTWIIGEVIGSGVCGTVYCAADKESPNNFDYAVKIEYEENGGLESEIDCYMEIANPVKMSDWTEEKKLRYLGLSPFYAYGNFTYKSSEYIFLVMKRFGEDLQTLLDKNNGTFSLKTVCLIGLSMIDVLEYIHSCEYVHGDIKASNILLGREKGTENQVYLVDFTLGLKYIFSGKHLMCHLGAAHAGTPIFVSRDAHKSSFTQRSDMEVLAYNLICWLTGHLLWEDDYERHDLLQSKKEMYMADIDNFLRMQFKGKNVPSGISNLLHHINKLKFEEKPNYDYCRTQLKEMLKSAGYSDADYTLVFT